MKIEFLGRRELRAALRVAGKDGMRGLAKGLTVEAEAVMAASKREVDVDEGVLRASGFVRRPVKKRRGMFIVLGYGGAGMPYGLYLHEGTGPAVGRAAFFPPVAPFREWAKRVLGDESLGFLVARAVGRKGLTPRKFLERPLRRRARGMAGRLARHVRRGMGT